MPDACWRRPGLTMCPRRERCPQALKLCRKDGSYAGGPADDNVLAVVPERPGGPVEGAIHADLAVDHCELVMHVELAPVQANLNACLPQLLQIGSLKCLLRVVVGEDSDLDPGLVPVNQDRGQPVIREHEERGIEPLGGGGEQLLERRAAIAAPARTVENWCEGPRPLPLGLRTCRGSGMVCSGRPRTQAGELMREEPLGRLVQSIGLCDVHQCPLLRLGHAPSIHGTLPECLHIAEPEHAILCVLGRQLQEALRPRAVAEESPPGASHSGRQPA
mmetsp:Transcript_108337/g.316951  ORF Transcript_108337/g.316951 Transcript_108337/m.316951 type:complete len:275 (-) Transcript_108337:485-1309(-)